MVEYVIFHFTEISASLIIVWLIVMFCKLNFCFLFVCSAFGEWWWFLVLCSNLIRQYCHHHSVCVTKSWCDTARKLNFTHCRKQKICFFIFVVKFCIIWLWCCFHVRLDTSQSNSRIWRQTFKCKKKSKVIGSIKVKLKQLKVTIKVAWTFVPMLALGVFIIIR